jgi:hypothetical protein
MPKTKLDINTRDCVRLLKRLSILNFKKRFYKYRAIDGQKNLSNFPSFCYFLTVRYMTIDPLLNPDRQ